jgi:hypothetical protein
MLAALKDGHAGMRPAATSPLKANKESKVTMDSKKKLVLTSETLVNLSMKSGLKAGLRYSVLCVNDSQLGSCIRTK